MLPYHMHPQMCLELTKISILTTGSYPILSEIIGKSQIYNYIYYLHIYIHLYTGLAFQTIFGFI